MRVWISVLVIPPEVEAKLREKHALTGDEVREAILLGAHTRAQWNDHPQYGRRLLVRGTTAAGRPLLATLLPIDETDGRWECKTAWPWRLK